ncbi:hypothetical protein HDU98_007877 [Podochytrium sp. JEL0797]|nr:hypothetical protein HDU98_007877 [Podochytrium sp. JEL0797]
MVDTRAWEERLGTVALLMAGAVPLLPTAELAVKVDSALIINAGGGDQNAAIDCSSLKIVPGNFYAGAPPHTVGGLSVTSCGSTATISHNGRSVTVTIAWNAGGSDKTQSYFELDDSAMNSLLNGQSFPGQFEGTCTGTCPLPH